jgi:hypothetical protein
MNWQNIADDWLLFVLIKQAKYYAQDTGNQYSILGRLICVPDWEFSPMKLGKKIHIGTGADIRPKKRSRKITASALNPFSELLPNLYYSLTWIILRPLSALSLDEADTGNQYSILGRLICVPDCDKTSEKRKRKL